MTVMDPGDDRPPVDTGPGLSSEHADVSAPIPALTDEQVKAFSAFYRDQAPRVATHLRVQGAEWAEAADATQEAMISAYQRWDTLTNPAAWVRTVATREFIRRRTRSREDAVEDIPEPVTCLLRDDIPAAAAEHREQEERIQELLSRLPARQRQVLAWTFDGYTPTEIAAQLSTPELPVTPEAVRSSLKDARRRLAQHVEPVPEPPHRGCAARRFMNRLIGPGKDQP